MYKHNNNIIRKPFSADNLFRNSHPVHLLRLTINMGKTILFRGDIFLFDNCLGKHFLLANGRLTRKIKKSITNV